MKVKFIHDFTGNSVYPLPFVIVYQGTWAEINQLANWVDGSENLGDKARSWIIDVDPNVYSMSVHFKEKDKAAYCRLVHG